MWISLYCSAHRRYKSHLYSVFTEQVTQSVQPNTMPHHFVRPELASAVHKSEDFVFPSTDRVTQLVNTESCAPIILPNALTTRCLIRHLAWQGKGSWWHHHPLQIASMVYFLHDTTLAHWKLLQTDRSLTNPSKKVAECSQKRKLAVREEVLGRCYGLTHKL